jgi:hypothetical protein
MTLSTRLDLDRRRRDVRWLQKNGRVVHHGGRVNQLDRGLVRGLIAVHRWLRKNGRVVHHSGRVNQLEPRPGSRPDRGPPLAPEERAGGSP